MDYPYLDTVIYDNFYEMLKGRYEDSKNKTAIRFMPNDKITDITYGDMVSQIAGIHAFYEEKGIKGKHIGIYSENRYEYITIYLATVMDNVIVPIDKELTETSLSDLLDDFDVDYLFVTDETNKKLESEGFKKGFD